MSAIDKKCCDFFDCNQGRKCPLRQPIRRDGGEQVEDGMRIQMFDDNHPTDWLDHCITWVMNHALATVFVFAMAALWLGVIAFCFGR